MDGTIYDAAGGREALFALANAWHRRCLDDPVVSHAFSHPGGHPHHLARLAAYWGEALGGPSDYTDEMGDHSHVLRMHAGNGKHDDMDRRAETCFAHALDDAGLPDGPLLRSTLTEWFHWAITDVAAYPESADDVPTGVRMPQWSWDGLVREG